MWSTGRASDTRTWFERLREIGFTAEQCTRGNDARPFVENGFGFYVENLVPELGFLNNRQAIYDADWRSYTSTRDKQYLVRKPCFHDPAFWEEAQRNLQSLVRPYVSQRPLLYDLRDELSIGSFASPMDYCFGPHTLREFRRWLEQQYRSIDRLNEEWQTGFSSFDEVVPMTTYEVKDRERAALAEGRPENYAPWADHREFMDRTFAETLSRMRDFIREVDPSTPVGIEGLQMASAWGGYDLWRLSKSVDWVEPYDIAGSRRIFRSFMPAGAPVLSTVFGSDYQRIRRNLWWQLLNGSRGLILWDDEQSRSIEKSTEGLPVTERGRNLAPIFAELREFAPKMSGLERMDNRIAIHYSQASIRAHWMFDSREDRDTWPRRFSSYEAVHSRLARVRDSFMRVVEDLGLQYNFVSYEQIENGELERGGYRVLLLPQSVAMSARECDRIRDWVRAGGVVIADNMTATMNERARRLSSGQLDDLFGIQRSDVSWRDRSRFGWDRPYEADIQLAGGEARSEINGVPVIVERREGDGRAIYLNLGMHDYGRRRLTSAGAPEVRELFRGLIGIDPPVRIEGAAGIEITRYRGNGREYIALMRNPEFAADSLKAIGYGDNSELESPARLTISFSAEADVANYRTGETYGRVARLDLDLDPWSPVILEMRYD
jgi:glycosyl hydrolase family 42 (putative beta-galactosidase)